MVDTRKLHAEALASRKSTRNKNKPPPSYAPQSRSRDPIGAAPNTRKSNLSASRDRKRKQSKTSATENEVEAEPIPKRKGRKVPAAKATQTAASFATQNKAGEPPKAASPGLNEYQQAQKDSGEAKLRWMQAMLELDAKDRAQPPDSARASLDPSVSEATDSAAKGAMLCPLKPSNLKSPPESLAVTTSTLIPTPTINLLHEDFLVRRATSIKKKNEVSAANEEVFEYDRHTNHSEDESDGSTFSDISQTKSPAKSKKSKGELKGIAVNDPPYNPFEERASLSMFGNTMSSKWSYLQFLPKSTRSFYKNRKTINGFPYEHRKLSVSKCDVLDSDGNPDVIENLSQLRVGFWPTVATGADEPVPAIGSNRGPLDDGQIIQFITTILPLLLFYQVKERPGIINPIIHQMMGTMDEAEYRRRDGRFTSSRNTHYVCDVLSTCALLVTTNSYNFQSKMPSTLYKITAQNATFEAELKNNWKPNNFKKKDMKDWLHQLCDSESPVKSLPCSLFYLGLKQDYYHNFKILLDLFVSNGGNTATISICELSATPRTVFSRLDKIFNKMKHGIFDNIPELLENSVKVGSAVQNGYLVNEFLVLYTLLRGFVGDKNDIQKAIREKKPPLKYHGTAQATMVKLMKSLEITGEPMVDHFFPFSATGEILYTEVDSKKKATKPSKRKSNVGTVPTAVLGLVAGTVDNALGLADDSSDVEQLPVLPLEEAGDDGDEIAGLPLPELEPDLDC